MITHLAETRGFANHGWLKSHHTFSFANYYDPNRMGFGALRVINDDFIAGGMGFGKHPHRDMEIITIPLEGTLAHEDSMGHGEKIRKGEVQIMSAGTGIFHSEVNASPNDPVQLLQIWVLPKRLSVKPRYEQKYYTLKENELELLVSPEGSASAVSINQDAYFTMGKLTGEKSVTYRRHQAGNGVYVFIISGELEVQGRRFKARDGIGLTEFESLELKALGPAEVLLMEVPMAVRLGADA